MKNGGAFEVQINIEQASALRISDTILSLQASAWMRIYFNSVGDTVPNANKELEMHLERQEKLSIYELYQSDMNSVRNLCIIDLLNIFIDYLFLFCRWEKNSLHITTLLDCGKNVFHM